MWISTSKYKPNINIYISSPRGVLEHSEKYYYYSQKLETVWMHINMDELDIYTVW